MSFPELRLTFLFHTYFQSWSLSSHDLSKEPLRDEHAMVRWLFNITHLLDLCVAQPPFTLNSKQITMLVDE